ncbi:hypothetical protein BUY94_11720 [Mammaliicoccus fleurettii]|nr:hypothetical protein BUY94_11720 [Mammaliicoccus fleurettii]RIL53362.1 hypothetical protein BUY93_00205 [Mammaliicoccus fleurettii]RTX91859.1 hypothetical protein CD129_00590 [Mammaliicoccus fleurettii]HCN61610.1 hypothetical protein [Staphylococcus sp.]
MRNFTTYVAYVVKLLVLKKLDKLRLRSLTFVLKEKSLEYIILSSFLCRENGIVKIGLIVELEGIDYRSCAKCVLTGRFLDCAR